MNTSILTAPTSMLAAVANTPTNVNARTCASFDALGHKAKAKPAANGTTVMAMLRSENRLALRMAPTSTSGRRRCADDQEHDHQESDDHCLRADPDHEHMGESGADHRAHQEADAKERGFRNEQRHRTNDFDGAREVTKPLPDTDLSENANPQPPFGELVDTFKEE